MQRELKETNPLSPQSDGHENYDNSQDVLHESAKSPKSIGNCLTSKFFYKELLYEGLEVSSDSALEKLESEYNYRIETIV